MRDESLEFLKTLLTTPSPTGFEYRGQKVWKNFVATFADEVESDSYGNVYATINPGGSPTIMLTGHADEIGLMVNYISDEGMIYYKQIGGVDPALVRGKRVNIHTGNGTVRGITAAPPIHLAERDGDSKAPKHHENFIDIGVENKEAAEALVEIGDPITFVDDFEILRDDVAISRGFDNRIGTWAAAEALRLLAEQRDNLQAKVVAVSTVMEEIGGHGAHLAAYRLEPDVAIVVDVTHATDWPGPSKTKHGDVKMGKGPVIEHSALVHPVVRKRLVQVAKANEIPVQFAASPGSTYTDMDDIFKSRLGVASALISLPNRYMHTTVEMIRLNELNQIAKLMAAFALDVKQGEEFKVEI